ncbi:MAG TPA: ATP-binding cassette domain-containing protein [Frankiaceae bacterium]|nr:ATP-binding cassette domain-containing protein [Frankiaceae bacterium]
MAIVELRGVTKEFSVTKRAGRLRRVRTTVRAVDDLDLDVREGEVCGYLGPNGAGKSTTVKMLTGILTPTRGRVTVAGLEPTRDRVRLAQSIGVVFGHRTQLWWDLPLGESFDLLRHVYRIPADRHRRDLAELVELLDLGDLRATPVRQLSLGQRMRGDLAAALLHAPRIVYLDEPTIGLDVVSKARVREFLAGRNRERGVTILLTTHDLADVERLCTRVVIIDAGRVICDGTVSDVKDRYGARRTLVVDLDREHPPLRLDDAETVAVDGVRQHIAFRRGETTPARLIEQISAVAGVVDMAVAEPDIEDVVRRIYAESAAANRGD